MSSSGTFRTLAHSSPPELAELMRRSRQLQLVARRVRNLLPAALARECQPGNVVNDTLYLYVSSPVWATRLRYLAPELVKELRLRPEMGRISKIRIVVQPEAIIQEEVPAAPPPQISPANAELLDQAAATAATPRLSAALRRLARRGGDDRATVRNPPEIGRFKAKNGRLRG